MGRVHPRSWTGIDTYAEAAAAAEGKRAGSMPATRRPEELAAPQVQLPRASRRSSDRAALSLTDADRAKLEGEGRRPHWRFKLEPRNVDLERPGARGPAYRRAQLSPTRS